MKSIMIGVIGVLSGLLLAGAIFLFVLPEKGDSILISTSTPSPIICHLDGAVNNPGVYSFNQGDRVEEAISTAGGLTNNADITQINFAEKVSDGEKIYIPCVGEDLSKHISSVESQDVLDQININTASIEELCKLSGIGESKANDIVEYRETHGDFLNIHDLLNVPGIGEAIFDKIEQSLSID
ncbi:MAG: helix-hairpin-helix domain-containing protein [Anaerolineaceae bacterium]|nr:helix-hairpin-helix domain-containing protein [Anaerolineaceae bacterium]